MNFKEKVLLLNKLLSRPMVQGESKDKTDPPKEKKPKGDK